VYRARQERFDRTVALKVLAVDLVDERARRRFRRECLLAGRLSEHPYVVTVFDAGTTKAGRPFIAMEYCEAGSLADRLRQHGPLPLDEVLRTAIKLTGALAAAHEGGIVHRDVKPQNVLRSRFGEPALADFGVAAFANATENSVVTDALTPVHAAPEVLEGNPATAAADLYSLGSMLYALLAGGAPYARQAGEGIVPLLLRILEGEAPRIPRDDVPDKVMAVLRQVMSREPEQRFGGDAAAFGKRLQQLQAGLGLPVTELICAAPATPIAPPGPALPPLAGSGGISPTDTTPRQRPGSTTVERRPPPPPADDGPISQRRAAARPASGTGSPAPGPGLAPAGAGGPLLSPLNPLNPLGPASLALEPVPAPVPLPAVAALSFEGEAATELRRGRRAAGPVEQPLQGSRRGRWLLALTLAAVVAIAAGIGVALRLQLKDRHQTQTTAAGNGTGSTATTPITSNTTNAGATATTIAPAVIDAARPTGLTAVASGTTATLHWRNPAGSRYPLFLSQRAARSNATLQALINGLTTTTVTGLDPTRDYCFRVVAALSFGAHPVTAASAPACIRRAAST